MFLRSRCWDQNTPTKPGSHPRKLVKCRTTRCNILRFRCDCDLQTLDAVRLAGLKVPEDISVVGFDDIPMAAWHLPPAHDHKAAPPPDGQRCSSDASRSVGRRRPSECQARAWGADRRETLRAAQCSSGIADTCCSIKRIIYAAEVLSRPAVSQRLTARRTIPAKTVKPICSCGSPEIIGDVNGSSFEHAAVAHLGHYCRRSCAISGGGFEPGLRRRKSYSSVPIPSHSGSGLSRASNRPRWTLTLRSLESGGSQWYRRCDCF